MFPVYIDSNLYLSVYSVYHVHIFIIFVLYSVLEPFWIDIVEGSLPKWNM